MDRATIAALNRINRQFYSSHAADFSTTREGAWQGWLRLLESVRKHRPSTPPLRILDVGCGNGRFGRLATHTFGPPGLYVALDQSLALMAEAESRGPCAPVAVDLSRADSSIPLSSASVGLAVALGVLHHIPSFDHRRDLVADITRCLEPGGLLALSHWQFANLTRFQRRLLPWSDAVTLPGEEIDPSDLEEGDKLLAWGSLESPTVPVRYCHHVDPEEAERLIVGLPCELLEVFSADGHENRLNLYHLLRRCR